MKLNKKSGFTLIELLAVIVVLATILLIATPIILNTIEDAKKSGFKSSAGMLLKTAENKFISNQIVNKQENILITYENGILTSEYDLDYKGDKPRNGTLVVNQDGKIGIAIDNGKWCALKNYDEEQVNLIKLENDNCKLNEIPEIPIISNPFNEEKGVNRPQLTTGMIPIVWNEVTKEWDNIDPEDNNWYDYNTKKWANAKTKDGSMWVWIPRYAYKITIGYHTSTAGQIDIKFLKERTNETVDGTSVETSGYQVGIKDTKMNYFLHPAFQFDGDELGFWVAKFEATAEEGVADVLVEDNTITKTVKIIPNATPWKYLNIGTSFQVSLNMKEKTSVYGWDTSKVDTHLIKNIEWGAIAYLSKSKYGANEEIWNNAYSQSKTGCSGRNVNDANYNVCLEYNTPNGVKASTTHNIYGVYDMSGGGSEIVATYIDNNHSNLTLYGGNMSKDNEKYVTTYKKGNPDNGKNNYEINKNIYGDAIYETSANGESTGSWYGDDSWIAHTQSLVFSRGGFSGRDIRNGIFNFNGTTGELGAFRPVLFIK